MNGVGRSPKSTNETGTECDGEGLGFGGRKEEAGGKEQRQGTHGDGDGRWRKGVRDGGAGGPPNGELCRSVTPRGVVASFLSLPFPFPITKWPTTLLYLQHKYLSTNLFRKHLCLVTRSSSAFFWELMTDCSHILVV